MKFSKYLLMTILAITPLTVLAHEEKVTLSRPTPILTASGIIEVFSGNEFKGIILINNHKEIFGKSLPRAKVFCKERLEDALCWKIQHIMNLNLQNLRQFHVYTDLTCNCIYNTVDVVHLAKVYLAEGQQIDAAIVSLRNIPWHELSLAEQHILQDYIEYRHDSFTDSMIKP